MLSPERGLQSTISRAGLLDGLGDEPLPFDMACARVLACSDALLAREADEEDPRDLSFALGALLYGLTAGAPAPRRASLFLAHERAMRRALGELSLDDDASSLIRQLMAWDPARRPWPDVALERIRAFAPPDPGDRVTEDDAPEDGAPEDDAPTELAADDAPTDTLPADTPLEPVQVSADRFTIADDQEILFLPDGPSRPTASLDSLDGPVTLDDPSETDDPFSIPDQTRVVHHRHAWQIGLGPSLEEDPTDPEVRSGLREDEHTDSGVLADHAVPMPMDDPSPPPPGLAVEQGPDALVPMPAPLDVRLDAGGTSPPPVRLTPPPAPQRAHMPTWLAAGLLLAAIAVGAAIAVALRL